jgi:hypothetical protein
MPNTSSNGKFGTSMDYSQLLEIRRKYVGVNEMRVTNPRNNPEIKPHFNQDKLVREFRTNGAVDFYFTRGLTPIYRRVGTGN